MKALQNYKQKYCKAASMVDLLDVINYDTKITQKRITLMKYFHSNQVFPAAKQTKGENIKDAWSTKVFHQNHGNKQNPVFVAKSKGPQEEYHKRKGTHHAVVVLFHFP